MGTDLAAVRRHRLELQYDGTDLHGWAKQQGLPTVQGCLEEAFRIVLGAVPAMTVAGRTDAGVHARRQVVSLDLPEGLDRDRLRAALNALTPPGIAVTRVVPAPSSFDARKDALSRIYRYHLWRHPAVSPFWARYSWHVPGELDVESMQEAAAAVVGRHDLTAFTPRETEHVFFKRLVHRCRWVRASRGVLYLEIEAEAYLRHMVRILVGTMVDIGKGKRSTEEFLMLLEGRPREQAGPTAPPQGLFLWDIRYRPRIPREVKGE